VDVARDFITCVLAKLGMRAGRPVLIVPIVPRIIINEY
jgi:hypothetical protein